ncbi:MAG: hypothetical protein JW762_09390 [Dehalococcoidales bacterium]|nr:hypothetical protein [Dehalococcoidales bacterium]
MVWKYVILWFGLVLLAILNGLTRDKVYRRYLSELSAHQASTVSFILLMGIYVWIFSNIWPLESSGQALSIGGIWLAITIIFEFIFGHYARKKPWQVLFDDYNIGKGRVWILVLLWTLLAPFTFYHL